MEGAPWDGHGSFGIRFWGIAGEAMSWGNAAEHSFHSAKFHSARFHSAGRDAAEPLRVARDVVVADASGVGLPGDYPPRPPPSPPRSGPPAGVELAVLHGQDLGLLLPLD